MPAPGLTRSRQFGRTSTGRRSLSSGAGSGARVPGVLEAVRTKPYPPVRVFLIIDNLGRGSAPMIEHTVAVAGLVLGTCLILRIMLRSGP